MTPKSLKQQHVISSTIAKVGVPASLTKKRIQKNGNHTKMSKTVKKSQFPTHIYYEFS